MSASDETKSNSHAEPGAEPDVGATKVLDHEPTSSVHVEPFKHKIRLYGALFTVIMVTALAAAGTYPYWRLDAAWVLAQVDVDLEKLEARLNIPHLAITHWGQPAVVKNEMENVSREAAGRTNKVGTILDSPAIATPKFVQPTVQVASTTMLSLADLRESTTILGEKVGLVEEELAGIEGRLVAVEQSLNVASAASREAAKAPTTLVPGTLSGQLDLISLRLLELEARQGEIADAGVDRGAVSPDSALIGTLVMLVERVAAMEARTTVDPTTLTDIRDESRALGSRVTELNAQLEKMDLELREEMPVRDRAALLLLSVSQLAAVTSGAGSFESQLDALHVVTDGQPAFAGPVGKLALHAATGATSLAGLQIEFADAANAAIRGRDVGTVDGIFGKILSRIASLVTVRKIDDIKAGTVDGALAAAEVALAEGDIEAAIKALKDLVGAPGAAVAPWMSRARARLDVDTAISDLRAAALGALGAAG